MNTFRKWNGKKIEDWGTTMSDDAKKFYRAFKNYLQREFPDAELIGFKPNHYDFSGFIKQGDNYIYISHAIDRYRERVDFNDSGVSTGVLYRTAEGPKDYRGGKNNFCSIFKLGNCVRSLFDRMEKEKAFGVTESKVFNEKLYSRDEIQDMVTACKKDPKLKKKILNGFTSAGPLGKKDKDSVARVIDLGDASAFDRYDSAVADKFISSYERANESRDANAMVDMILEGASLDSVVFNKSVNEGDTVDFAGNRVNYVVNKTDAGEIDSIDIGDGQLVDSEGDPYFVHLEYDPKKGSWLEEIWYSDDRMTVKDWYDFTEHESMKDLKAIEKMFVA